MNLTNFTTASQQHQDSSISAYEDQQYQHSSFSFQSSQQ